MKKVLSLMLACLLLLSLVACGTTPPTDTDNDGTVDPVPVGFGIPIDLTEEWDKVSDTALVQGCLVVRTGFSDSHANEMASFLSEYNASIDYIKNPEHIDAAATMVASAGILPNAVVAKNAIPRSNIAYMDGTEMATAVDGFLSALNIAKPTDNFYYAPTGDATAADDSVIRIGYFPGTTGIGLAKLINDGSSHYAFTKYSAPAEIITAIAQGNVDVAALPTNAVPQVYNSTNGAIRMLAVNTLGVLYICTNGVTLTSLGDLAGKTIYVPENAPKLVLQYILNANHISATVSMEYDLDTLPNALAQGIVTIGLLPEPKVTVTANLYAQAHAAQ